eukprot:TRINITY_DN23_c1_g1_i5.p1 TRINITY_DN23_c1_g1~~TRINITY_DN23_c1_g1_i5.p1  ORF type:complete len:438 (-),score=98.64 TRINITY_DN23_c1_g1_i5:254-1567(-)
MQRYQVRFMRGAREEDDWETPLHEQARVLELIRDSFDPIKDGISGVDLLPYMVKSQSTEDGVWDFAGMCILQLKQNHKLVGAAIFRIFGDTAAEIPLVAVRAGDRGQGHCRTMITILENLFRELELGEMILPAAPGTFKMWQEKFGCRPLGFTHAKKLRQLARFMCFPDCTMVYKYLNDKDRPEYDDEKIDDILAMSDKQVEEILEQQKLFEEASQKQKQQQQMQQQQQQQQQKLEEEKQQQQQKQVKEENQCQKKKSYEIEKLLERESDISDMEVDDEEPNQTPQLSKRQLAEFSTPKTSKRCDSEMYGFTKDSSSSSKDVILNFDDTPIKAEDQILKENSIFPQKNIKRVQLPRSVSLQDMQHLPEYLQKSNNNTYRSICIIKNIYEEDQFVKQLLGESCEETTSSENGEQHFQNGQQQDQQEEGEEEQKQEHQF